MFVRLTYISINPGKSGEVKQIYTEDIAPVIRQQQGIKEVKLFEPLNPSDDYISCTTWESESDLKAFESGSSYQEVFGKIKAITSKPPYQKYFSAF